MSEDLADYVTRVVRMDKAAALSVRGGASGTYRGICGEPSRLPDQDVKASRGCIRADGSRRHLCDA